ncbi:uracil-DNA glycosylase [[Mycobacterium] kokjensenii]|uniref:Uracil-DNA glycosylase n=1 Tax=[Mycobacterium] kokjensenii TaxID=3064287 RepID=A0ABN9MTR7_9MYCO|nr:uracil-DNA glycosylase [Mycolicibacter sp. MU0083]CAJ1495012.1 uracil-DNA glycosylase [Mycolicibacter sp. MU0083]
MVRRMRDANFKASQIAHQSDPHIAPINAFVDQLVDPDGRGWLPKVAPLHGGVDAKILSVLSDPGKATREGSGSGFLCIENDDATAEAQCKLFADQGIPPRWVLPWNAYPWFIDRAPNAEEKKVGAVVLCKLIDMVETLEVVLLQGVVAAAAWKHVKKLRPSLDADRGLKIVESIHPSKQALWTPDPAGRQARLERQQRAFDEIARIVHGQAM